MNADRLIFGCQSITAGSSLRASTRILDCAIDLGITRFDVAPSYGLGTAEQVVGQVLNNRTGLRVSTKVGVEPPTYGSFKALFREPYRLMRRIAGMGSPDAAATGRGELPPRPLDVRNVDVVSSVARSKSALGGVKIDALLAHEALGPDTLAGFNRMCELEIAAGTISAYGYSGGRASLEWNIAHLSLPNCVLQCSFRDAPLYPNVEDLRLFGVVSTIAPIVKYMTSIDPAYSSDLLDCLKSKVLERREQFVVAVAIACSLAERASIIVATNHEMTLSQAMAGLQNSSLQKWVYTHTKNHADRIWDRTSIDSLR